MQFITALYGQVSLSEGTSLAPKNGVENLDLFASPPSLPEGFRYQREVISREMETALLAEFRDLPFKEFEFHGYTGKRRVVSYGWQYDYSEAKLRKTDDIPEFLKPVREIAARFAAVTPGDLQHVLVTEYSPGAPIGWHRDKAVFGDIIGISLLSSCTFRLRRKVGAKWERASIVAEPRSAYLMRGPSRTEWEHSIPPVDSLRYSITLRNFRES
ncbi:MAG TPA: alpha-ketoglutarate-dependent dioxygenase AlkB [Gemmatimonadaceae bacterium]|nr:alpha-ketoglutarate-dependent dioxygenase AlkB [Gemmatimonadaceae bacterium]